MNLSESHKASLELLSKNKLKSALPPHFYNDIGSDWGGPAEVKRTIEKFISVNPLEVYYISPQIYKEVNDGILKQRLVNNVKDHVSKRHGLLLFSTGNAAGRYRRN